MKLTESLNRSFNLLAVSLTALPGFSFAIEIFHEKDWDDKGDDIALLLFGVVGIVWYLTGANRFKRSVLPLALVLMSFVSKAIGLVLEFHDMESAGDEFGGVIMFALAACLIGFMYGRTKSLLAEASPGDKAGL